MALVELPDLIQGTDEWLEQRRGMVTASVVGKLITSRALTGIDYPCPECAAPAQSPCLSKVRRGGESATPIKTLHPYRIDMIRALPQPPVIEPAANDDSRGLTALLVAERITGHVDPVYVTSDMQRGHDIEPIARALYSERYTPVRESGFMVLTRPGFKLGYSPDGLVGDDGLIEVKAPRAKKHLTTILSGQVPPEHMPQLQAGLLVSGRQWIDFVSYHGGMPMWVQRVEPDPRWEAAIQDAVQQFEENAARMVEEYERATEGLPETEPYFGDLEIVL